MQQSSTQKTERLDFIIGMAVTIAVLALFGWLFFRVRSVFKSNAATRTSGEITAEGQAVRGSEQIFTYLPTEQISDGAPVVWTVDGEVVAEESYVNGAPVTMRYTPSVSGTYEITATVGKYTKNFSLDVAAPKLTLTAPNITVVYGDVLPEMTCIAEGFVAEEGDDLCRDCHTVDCDGAPKAGVYRIVPDTSSYLDYQTETVYGTLTVLPKRLNVTSGFVKTYDGTSVLSEPTVSLGGVLEGDDVRVRCDKLYFDNKNVGSNKQLMLSSAALEGDDADNYILPDFTTGTILPKAVVLEGLTVKDKIYDGTTKASIDRMGALVGVCEGDSVAIGSVKVSFDSSDAGVHNVTVSDVSLVGADKDNYLLVKADCRKAEIEAKGSLWDRLFTEPSTETQIAD